MECLVSLASCFSTIRTSECNTSPQQNLQCPVKFKPFVEGKFDRGEHLNGVAAKLLHAKHA